MLLTGFMGAGKSTVGRLLAPRLGWCFVDTDALLTKQMGGTIADLFREYGEERFRTMEATLIAELLEPDPMSAGVPGSGGRTVIALGGGALEHAGTRAALINSPRSLVVYLEAPLAVSLARCAAEAGAALRPVLADAAVLEARFVARLPTYRAAHLTVTTSGLSPDEVAVQIAAYMAQKA